MGDAPSFCGPLHLYPVSVRELIVCRTGVLLFFLFVFFNLSTLTAGICVYTVKPLVELKDPAEALE